MFGRLGGLSREPEDKDWEDLEEPEDPEPELGEREKTFRRIPKVSLLQPFHLSANDCARQQLRKQNRSNF